MTQTFKISLFKHKRDTTPQTVERSWQQLCSNFQKPQVRFEKDGLLFSPAKFEPAYRRKENVREVSMLVLDIDHNAELETLKKGLSALDSAFAIGSTHSHLRRTETNPNAEPRFRVCLPLACPIPAKDFPALWQYARAITGLPLDESAKDASRMFYTPAIAALDAPYTFHIKDGSFLDWQRLPLDSFASNDNNANRTSTDNQTNGNEQKTRNLLEFEFHEDRHAELCRRIETQAKPTGRGAFEMKCPAHNGNGDSSLFYAPDTKSVKCLKGCDYFKILRAFGLSNERLPSREHAEAGSINGNGDALIPLPENNLPTPQLDEKLLPMAWREWLSDVSERLQCPLDYAAISALVASASLIGNRIRVRPKRLDSWLVVPNLWGAIVGIPGVMKTPAVNEGLIFYREIAEKERLNFEESQRNAEFEKDFCEAKKASLKKEMAKAKAGDKEKFKLQFLDLQTDTPKEKRLWTTDVTVEKLGELLNENPDGLLILRDELTGWFRMLDRTGHEQDRAFYLEAWNGEGSFTFDRIGRGKTHVRNLTVSILGTIQPAMIEPYLRGSLEGFGDDGLIQRFQLLVYPETPKTYQYVDRLPKGRTTAREAFKRLYSISPEDVNAKRLTDEAGGYAFLQFDDESQEFFQTWLTELENDLRSDTFETSTIESHLSKYRSLMPSLALIFHLLDRVTGKTENTSISLNSAMLASAWCSYLQKHAEKLYGMVALSEFDYAKEILNRIENSQLANEFTARDIYGKHWKKLSKPEQVKSGLEILTEYGYLTSFQIETGGRVKTIFSVNENLR